MDRRRFVPTPDGLEGRDLLSLFGSNGNTLNNAAADVPVTFRQKELRIEHLPFYLERLQPGRFLSTPDVMKLQADLYQVAGNLHKPPFPRLITFNNTMRTLMTDTNLSATDVNQLNKDFTDVVAKTGATAEETANLAQDLSNLAKTDSQSRQPVFLATNDYALVLQDLLGIDRPIQTPLAPQIAIKDGTRTQPGFAITTDHQFRLVGSYGVGGTVGPFAGDPTGGFNSANDVIKIVDNKGDVFGVGVVDNQNGDYTVKPTNPLPDGVYEFRVVAVDDQGHFSSPSSLYIVKVISKGDPHPPVVNVTGVSIPKGPLGRP